MSVVERLKMYIKAKKSVLELARTCDIGNGKVIFCEPEDIKELLALKKTTLESDVDPFSVKVFFHGIPIMTMANVIKEQEIIERKV